MNKYNSIKQCHKKYRFFQHKECEFFPCHNTEDSESFNCLMCFCPLYNIQDCGGNYVLIKNGVKDCSDCLIPHVNYDYIINKLKQKPAANP